MVTAEGGRGIAVRTDHTVESEVERLFERVRAEEGRLDVLVNDIWGGDALTEWGSPFWSLSTAQGQALLERAVHSHIITSRHGAPLMVERDAGLIVEVTDGDTLGYRGNLFYDLAKNAVVRLAYAMAGDLHAHRVTALAVTPGFLRPSTCSTTSASPRRTGGTPSRRTRTSPSRRRPATSAAPWRRWPPTPMWAEGGQAVLELGIGEGVRLHGRRRTPAGLGQLLPAQGAGNPRQGDAAGRPGPVRGPLPALPGRARPVRGRGSRAPARLAGQARVARESVVKLRVAPRAGRRPAILRNACDAAAR